MGQNHLKEKSFGDIKVKKPTWRVYGFAATVVGFFTRIMFRIKVNKKALKGMKGPILALANHATKIDIMFGVPSLMPRRFNMVTGKDVFMWKSLRWFVKSFGCIPKSQAATDLMSMKIMKAAVEQGRNVLIYPEGKTSLDGKLGYIGPGIAKLIKFLDCKNVIVVKSKGAFLTRPRWANKERYGRMEMNIERLFTQEEARSLSTKDIYDRVLSALNYNDNEWQVTNNVRFKSKKPADRLDYVLYKCVRCGAEYEMLNDGRHLTCKACGNKVEYTNYGQIVASEGSIAPYPRIDLWADFERNELLNEIREGGFNMSKPVKLHIQNAKKKKYEECGAGELYINATHIGFKGIKDGVPYEESQELKNLATVITKNKEAIDLVFDDVIHRYYFNDKKWSVKYCFAVEQSYKNMHG